MEGLRGVIQDTKGRWFRAVRIGRWNRAAAWADFGVIAEVDSLVKRYEYGLWTGHEPAIGYPRSPRPRWRGPGCRFLPHRETLLEMGVRPTPWLQPLYLPNPLDANTKGHYTGSILAVKSATDARYRKPVMLTQTRNHT